MDYSPINILKTIVLVCLGIALSLLAFAPVIEITDPNGYKIMSVDPVSGLPLYIPNSSVTLLTGCFENSAVINNIGFHGPPVAVEKGKDVFRIVVIGSSFIEARQVQVASMFSTLLEQKLNDNLQKAHTYEVIPLGFNGNGTFLNTLYYKYYGSPLKPDLVIAIETGFELYRHLDNPPLDQQGKVILEAPKTHDSAAMASLKALLRNSKLLVNLYSRSLMLKDASLAFIQRPFFFIQAPAPKAKPDKAQAEQVRWNLKEKVIDALLGQTKVDHAQFLYAAFAGREEPTSTIEEISRHMEDMALQKGFEYDNLVPSVFAAEEATGKPAALLPCDGHWSKDGHQFVASALFEYLSRHPALLGRP